MSSSSSSSVILTREKKEKYIEAIYLAFSIFKNKIAKDTNFEINKHRIVSILKDYDRLALCLKDKMNHGNSDKNIDSHKIAAIFLVLVLKHKDLIVAPQGTRKEKRTLYYVPHIYFGFVLGTVIMESMYNIDLDEKVTFNINMNYGREFAKLVYANEKAILTPAFSTDCDNSIKGIFCLSHIFYFIETTTDKTKITI